jgi:hypothetical protein
MYTARPLPVATDFHDPRSIKVYSTARVELNPQHPHSILDSSAQRTTVIISRSPPRKKVRFLGPEAPVTPPLTPPFSKAHDQAHPNAHDREPALMSASETSHSPTYIDRAPQLPCLASTAHRSGGYVLARLREMEKIVPSDDLNPILGYVPLTPPPPTKSPRPVAARQRPLPQFNTVVPPIMTRRLSVPPVVGMRHVNNDAVTYTPYMPQAELASYVAPPSMDPVAVWTRRTYNGVGRHAPTAATLALSSLPHQRPLP